MSLVLQSFLPFPHSCQGPSPHQQGRDERMIEQCFGGIDVSQDRLDVLLLPQGTGFSVANDEAGWSTLIGRLRGLLLTAIGLEPSGGYERGVLRALLAAGLSVRRINPNRLRQFARARGALAKNDRLDARLIAEYVATMPTRTSCAMTLPPPESPRSSPCGASSVTSTSQSKTRPHSLRMPCSGASPSAAWRGSRPISASSRSASPRRSPPRPISRGVTRA